MLLSGSIGDPGGVGESLSISPFGPRSILSSGSMKHATLAVSAGEGRRGVSLPNLGDRVLLLDLLRIGGLGPDGVGDGGRDPRFLSRQAAVL